LYIEIQKVFDSKIDICQNGNYAVQGLLIQYFACSDYP